MRSPTSQKCSKPPAGATKPRLPTDALALYELKGVIPLARRTRERLAALQASTA